MKTTCYQGILVTATVAFWINAGAQSIRNDTLPVSTTAVFSLNFPGTASCTWSIGDGSFGVEGGGKKNLLVQALKKDSKDERLVVSEGGREHHFVVVYNEGAKAQKRDWSSKRKLTDYVKAQDAKARKKWEDAEKLYALGSYEAAMPILERLVFDGTEAMKEVVNARLSDCKTRIQEREDQFFVQASFRGDSLAAIKQFRLAHAEYTTASNLRKGDVTVQTKIKTNEKNWFDHCITIAKTAASTGKDTTAVLAYTEAREVDPITFDKIHKAAFAKCQKKANKQIYQRERSLGDESFRMNNLTVAKQAYEAAKATGYPDNGFCVSQLKKIERKQKYFQLLAEAEKIASNASTALDYDKAIKVYEEAARLQPSLMRPKDKIKEIKKLKDAL